MVTASLRFTSSPTPIQWVVFDFYNDGDAIERKVFAPTSGDANDGIWTVTLTMPATATINHTHGMDIIAQNGSTETDFGGLPGRTTLSIRANP